MFLHMRTVQVENRATDVFESTTLCHPLPLLFPSKRKISHQNVKFSVTLNQSDREKYQMGNRARVREESIHPGNNNFNVQNSWFLLELLSYSMFFYSVALAVKTKKLSSRKLLIFLQARTCKKPACYKEKMSLISPHSNL